jgi:hypothetical protein
MTLQSGNHLADLKILANYQQNQGRTVLFGVTMAPAGNQVEVTYHAMQADGKTPVTGEPVLRQRGIGKLALWESYGYIKVVTGSLKQRTSTIRLTESGMEIAAS